ncbi:P63C domain-containing protein [Chloroflexota bacterium]
MSKLFPMVVAVISHANALQKTQLPIAHRAEIIMRGLARVGITALIDAATGYEKVRDRDELNRILEAYISKELLPWTKRFPDEFYQQLFRLRGWQYRPVSVKRPKYVGKLTNELVYEKLPTGVLIELRSKNPVTPKGYRKHRHFQFLTDDIGNPHLEKQLVAVTTLMKVSPNWATFYRLFNRAYSPQGEFNFKEIEEQNPIP